MPHPFHQQCVDHRESATDDDDVENGQGPGRSAARRIGEVSSQRQHHVKERQRGDGRRAGVAEAAGDPVEAITAEFATAGAQLEDGAIVESTIEDPNFAGVGWVDGEVVVAVVDCAAADVATITALAGDAQLRIIQVDHTFTEVDAFRHELSVELRSHGSPGDVVIDFTTEGRVIEVRVPKGHELPADFGASVPSRTFSVRVVDDVFRDA